MFSCWLACSKLARVNTLVDKKKLEPLQHHQHKSTYFLLFCASVLSQLSSNKGKSFCCYYHSLSSTTADDINNFLHYILWEDWEWEWECEWDIGSRRGWYIITATIIAATTITSINSIFLSHPHPHPHYIQHIIIWWVQLMCEVKKRSDEVKQHTAVETQCVH